MIDAFIGTWKMLPEQNNYQFGNPPQAGLYIIAVDGEGYEITMQWTAHDGNAMNMSYKAIPDGKSYATDAPSVDTMSMTRVDDKTLDSDAKKDGVVVAYATRTLSDDNNTMTVKQSGKTPDGHDFTNTSIYQGLRPVR